ncbi:MAG: NUDIX domain-containing protein [Candidatus Pacebacteria bacterium]|nr:NUDIX domain-containing protein [Candidatus Paceibacterota bacterium]
MEDEYIKEKSCGIIPVYNIENPSFLLVKHKGGHWGFPKGHVENGETEEETAIREVGEEVGLFSYDIVENFKYCQTYAFYRKDIGKIVKEAIFFIGIIRNKEKLKIQEEELTGYGWFTYKEVLEKIPFEGNKKMTRVALKEIQRLNKIKNKKQAIS